MNDPHVVSLKYHLEMGEGLYFDHPPPLAHDTEQFTVKLEDATLVVSMKEHHPTVESAKERLAPFLRTWELDNELEHGAGVMRFVYETAEVIDRNPLPPGAPRAMHLLAGAATLTLTGSGRLTVGKRAYPPPPSTFLASADTLRLWNRLQGYREGKEPLSSMAYFCLTVLETRAKGKTGATRGKRTEAAKLYQVHKDVLEKLGELTSDRGDDTTGRKFLPARPALTTEEAGWVEDVVRALIRRAGEHAAGAAPLRQITMGDFRSLP